MFFSSGIIGPAYLSRVVRSEGAVFRMNVDDINAYLQRAQEIIGDRTPAEIQFDNSVVAHLSNSYPEVRDRIPHRKAG